MMRRASIKMDVSAKRAEALAALRAHYANDCNALLSVCKAQRALGRIRRCSVHFDKRPYSGKGEAGWP